MRTKAKATNETNWQLTLTTAPACSATRPRQPKLNTRLNPPPELATSRSSKESVEGGNPSGRGGTNRGPRRLFLFAALPLYGQNRTLRKPAVGRRRAKH